MCSVRVSGCVVCRGRCVAALSFALTGRFVCAPALLGETDFVFTAP
jgi:hypothetical protein